MDAETKKEKSRFLFWMAAIVVVGAVVYARYGAAGWIFDDKSLIESNDSFHQPFEWKSLGQDLGRVLLGRPIGFWRPGSLLLFRGVHALAGKNPAGWHFASAVLLIAAAWSFFTLLTSLKIRSTAAGLASLIFLVHPLNTEIVGISNQMNSTAESLFILLGAASLVRGRPYLCALLTACALSIRESAVVAPIIYALLIAAAPGGFPRKNLLRLVPAVLVTALWGAARFGFLNIPMLKSPDAIPLAQRMGYVAFLAARLIFLPIPAFLSVFHPPSPTALSMPLGWAAIACTLPAAARLIRHARTNQALRLPALAFLAFLASAAPYSGIIQPFILFAEHYMQLPLAFLLCAAAAGLGNEAFAHRKIAASAAVALVVAFGMISFSRAGIFRDDATAFADAARKYPDSHFAHIEWGAMNFDRGDLDAAEREYREALRLTDGKNRLAWNNLGHIHYRRGDLAAAEECFRKAGPEGEFNLVILLYNDGRLEELSPILGRMIARNPKDPVALGILRAVSKKVDWRSQTK